MAKKILIVPLDWGLGHATRCIPLIRQQLLAGHEVVLAANGASAALLQLHFPQLSFLPNLPAYDIQYPANGSMAWAMVRQIPSILRTIKAENNWLSEAIKSENIEEVISDNRYGLHNQNVHCTFVTHQLFIQAPSGAKPLLNALVRKYVARFDTCLIPDFDGAENLSGALAHGNTSLNHVHYIGPLSRFSEQKANAELDKKYFALAIISGPEPQRSILQQTITAIFNEWKRPCAVLCGQPQSESQSVKGSIDFFSHAEDAVFASLVHQSEHIICRSGYSTLMDLHALNRSALLIPTPGQTEQEYLAKYHELKGTHHYLPQKALSAELLYQRLTAL